MLAYLIKGHKIANTQGCTWQVKILLMGLFVYLLL